MPVSSTPGGMEKSDPAPISALQTGANEASKAVPNSTFQTPLNEASKAVPKQVLKAALKDRFRNYRISRYILYITTFWIISIFLAPLSLEPHTVEDLDANANWVDYGDDWADMARYNPYAAAIYLFGDFNCHQRHTRSQTFHGNQLPVCARDVGIAAGAVIGALLLFFVIRTPFMFLTFLSVVPERFRTPLLKRLPPWLVAGLIALPLLLPTGFDGFYQLLTTYESTNTIRLVTGCFLGILLSWGFGSAFLSVTVPLPVYPPVAQTAHSTETQFRSTTAPNCVPSSSAAITPHSTCSFHSAPASSTSLLTNPPPSHPPVPARSIIQPNPELRNDTPEKKEKEE